MVKVEVISETFGSYKKGETLEMVESTAKACVKSKKVKILGAVKVETNVDALNLEELKNELATANESLATAKEDLTAKESELAKANENLTAIQEQLKVSEDALKKANAEIKKLGKK